MTNSEGVHEEMRVWLLRLAQGDFTATPPKPQGLRIWHGAQDR